MIHDKMCPDPDGRNHDKDCECEFIAAVRADERAKVLDAAETAILTIHKPFRGWTGQDQCEHCSGLCHSRSGLNCDEPDGLWPCPTINAIRALRGEK